METLGPFCDFPLSDAKIGDVVEFDDTFLISNQEQMEFELHSTSWEIIYWSKVELADNEELIDDEHISIYRYYLKSCSANSRNFNDNDFASVFVQIELNDKNIMEGCSYFKLLERFIPKDWKRWIDEEDGRIGRETYRSKSNEVYQRVWDEVYPYRVAPYHFIERILDGESIIKERNFYGMLYSKVRDIDWTSYILLSLDEEILESKLTLGVYSGIEIDPESFKLIVQ